ncbi:dickkopf-related protein 3 [Ornithorhynchus anatinus]|uniref:Dickkopf-related protein 3 n=1 Tax=Ornithorhynchus anatinus TaxID=9258 RepID=A0A6I8PBZ7_ORNAN|nr:dickkopf-related protein 3 [Ornithorhynchus anatinus]
MARGPGARGPPLPVPLLLLLLLPLAAQVPVPGDEPGPRVPQDEATLNEMFREVEELMEDTQHKLRSAVREMEAEEGAATAWRTPLGASGPGLPADFRGGSGPDGQLGGLTLRTHREMDKVTDNRTGQTVLTETPAASPDDGRRKHECVIDEDCGMGQYCQFSSFRYTCQPCKAQQAHCARDGECCGDQLCAWGLCAKDASPGGDGTICESQRDCRPGSCCAFQRELLFPVCLPLPVEGEPCHRAAGGLLDLITWELEPDGVLDRCPCAGGFTCRPHSHDAVPVCELTFNDTHPQLAAAGGALRDPLLWDPLLRDAPAGGEEEEDGADVIREVRKELRELERTLAEGVASLGPPEASDPLTGDPV